MANPGHFKMVNGTSIENGYPRISMGPLRKKYVHILIAEGMLGRELREDEHVHHIDGNRINPKWTNLLVLGESVHNMVSNKQYWYLKQKYAQERAAWWAYFDVTGETPREAWDRQERELRSMACDQSTVIESIAGISADFLPERLGG